MFNIGTPELIIIIAVALIFFGPKKLPEIGKSIGHTLREFRKASRDIVDVIEGRDEPEQEVTKENTHDATDSARNT